MTPWLLALILARSLDATSTVIALQDPRLVEAVPWMPRHPATVVAVQGGAAAVQVWVLRKWAVKHPKLARGLATVQIGVSGVAVTMNVRAMGSSR
jgi:hypothetical protein